MSPKKSNILLVEDEAIIALHTVKMLRERSYSVVHASSGEEAVELFRAGGKGIDLVLMDINLGKGMDGTDAAREILKLREVPVVFLSSHTEKDIVERTEAVSSYGYVVKNSGITILDASIKMAFRLFAAHRSLAVSEDRFFKAFILSPDSININRLSDGVFVNVNVGFTSMTGYSSEEIIGRSSFPDDLGIWVHAEDRVRLTSTLRELGEIDDLEAEFRRKDGTILIGLMSARIIEVEGEQCLLSITRDITERRLAEKNLASLGRVQAIVRRATQLILHQADTGKLLDGACRIAVEEGRLRMAWIGVVDEGSDLVRPVASAGFVDGYLDDITITLSDVPTGRGPTGMAARMGRISICADIEHDERMAWRQAALERGYRSMASFPLGSGPKTFGVFNFYSDEVGFFREEEIDLLAQLALDISYAIESSTTKALREEAEKKLRDSETRFRTAFEDAPVGMALADPAGFILGANSAFCELLGRSEEDIVSLPFASFTYSEDIEAGAEAVAACISGARSSARLVKRYLHNDGHPVWADVSLSLLRDEDGEPRAFIVHMLDIDERMRYEERLKSLVSQKETLMKELQHRVKNNLNVVSGLLGLEEENCSDEGALPAFANARARIASIAAIYERLYLSEDLSSVDLDLYVEDLAAMIFSTYNLDPDRIRIRIDADRARLDTKRAVPVGLILNELVSNALKYAYPNDSRGEVRVRLVLEGGSLGLIVADDGPGIPAERRRPEAGSMGMTLVRMLSEQLGAELRIDASGGTAVSVRFPL
jgi:PAS domain S-box-containing protein